MQKKSSMYCGQVLAISMTAALTSAAVAQPTDSKGFDTVVITARPNSLTQNAIETAKDNVKTIPGGASIVDLNQVREGRQSTWSDSLGLAPGVFIHCLLYTSPSPRDYAASRMPSSA